MFKTKKKAKNKKNTSKMNKNKKINKNKIYKKINKINSILYGKCLFSILWHPSYSAAFPTFSSSAIPSLKSP